MVSGDCIFYHFAFIFYSATFGCKMTVTPLTTVINQSHSYIGIIVMIYFLVSSAVLFAAFAHQYQKGTFHITGKLLHKFNIWSQLFNKQILPSVTVCTILCFFSTVFIAFHYIVIAKSGAQLSPTKIMDSICISLKSVAFLICSGILMTQKFCNQQSNRQILFETLILTVSLFGIYLKDVCKCVINFRLINYTSYLFAFDGIVEIFESTMQSTFLLSSMKYHSINLPKNLHILYQNCLIYLTTHNFLMLTFTIMQQSDEIYGKFYVDVFNVWFWAIFKFYVNSFVILYRVYSAVFFGSLLVRCRKNE